jgi:hypothetical protein
MNELQKAPNGFAPSLAERTEHRTWIKGRAATLLSHYWREDDDPALLAAIGKDWADVLEGIPQEYIQRACIQYQRDEPRRKPTPGAVYEIARAMMPRPMPVPVKAMSAEQVAEYQERAGRINPERKAQAEAILRAAGRKLGGQE